MRKIIFKYLFLMIPVLAAIIFIKSEQKTNEEAVKAVVNSEYITDLSTSSSGGLEDWGNNKEGSAKFLSGRTGIVTFFVGDDSTQWSKSDISTVCSKLNIAANYLMESGDKYEQNVELIYNMDDMLFYEWTEYKIKDWQDDNHLKEVYNWIDKDINCEKLLKKYDLDGLAFLVVLNGPGISYACPHTVEDERSGYYEVSYIYLFDAEYPDRYESPASYAHELLHLFGAIDLYDTGGNNLSTSLEEYIQQNNPNEIMYTTYHNGSISVSNDIEQEFSNITAYEVGFLSYLDELERFPELEKKYPACFSKYDGKIVLDKELVPATPAHDFTHTDKDKNVTDAPKESEEPKEEVNDTENPDETGAYDGQMDDELVYGDEVVDTSNEKVINPDL